MSSTAPPATTLADLHFRKSEIPDCYPKGRICAVPRCEQELCIWNPGPCCWPCGGKGLAELDTKPTAEALVELMEQV